MFGKFELQIWLFSVFLLLAMASAATQNFNWQIQYATVSRLCHTKSLVSVNGQYPGPTAYVREGDTVVVNVTNLVPYNITIHWHGVRQLLSAWADGPSYITQCPIQTGHSYVHRFQIVDQRGTLFWHAHISWLRATVYGAFIILPKLNVLYPFTTPAKENIVTFGEWWNANPEDIIAEALQTGLGYNISDALTINGQPGVLYPCSVQDTVVYNVTKGQTILLRLINAAVNFQLYFAVANHSLIVVEADAEYTQFYKTDVVLLAPGQTTNVLLTANQPVGQYYMAASVFSPAPLGPTGVPFPQTPTSAILSYTGSTPSNNLLLMPQFPVYNDTAFAASFTQSLKCRGFSSGYYYMDIPNTIDENLLFTVGYGAQQCPVNGPCIIGYHIAASINNITFKDPNISILQAYYNNISGVYGTDFPNTPPYQYNYTGPPPSDIFSLAGTKVKVLKFGSNVQIVFQDTSITFFESHPMHLHGQNFYIVGSGFGTFDNTKDPQNFNLLNPPSRNTVAVPSGGWAAVRFKATNPGVWYMHCHLDIHNSWGMAMAFIVLNGVGSQQTLPAPPVDLPPC